MNVDETLQNVLDDFDESVQGNSKISRLYAKVRDGTATYTEANQFAIECGNVLSKSYTKNLEVQLIDRETALMLLKSPLTKNYGLISEYCKLVEQLMNSSLGLDINAIIPALDIGRIEGLATAIGESTEALQCLKLFGDQIVNFSQNVVDSSIRENAKFSKELGFNPTITREYEGAHREHTVGRGKLGKYVDCAWCKSLAGTYSYDSVSNTGNDIYKRHEGCRCTLTYSKKGSSTTLKAMGHAFTRF